MLAIILCYILYIYNIFFYNIDLFYQALEIHILKILLSLYYLIKCKKDKA